MAEAQAKYTITAVDQTSGGFRSAIASANSFSRSIRGAFGPLLALGGAGLFAGVVKQSINLGDELNKASIKAGIAGKAMSELAFAAKQSDIGLADLSTSLRFMQKNLSEAASGSKTQQEAFDRIGTSVTALRSLAPEKQFEVIADRIAAIKDPADRARAATDLFGRSGANLLPLFEKGAAGIREARLEAQKLGVSFSNDQIKQLAEADDAIKKLSASWSGFATTMTAKVAPALTAVLNSLNEIASGKALERVAQAQVYAGLAQFGTPEQLAAFEAKNRPRRAGGPTGAQRFGSGPGIQASNPVPAYLEEVQTTALRFAEFQRQLADTRAMDAYVRSLQDAYETNQALIEASDRGINEVIGDSMEKIKEDMDLLADKSITTSETISEFAKSAAQNMQSYFADFLFDPFQDGIKGMLKGFVDSIRRMGAELAASKVFEFLGSKAGTGGVAGFIGSLFGGFKAGGGPVSAGKGYIVGERGPELFMPGSSGSIMPNQKLASSSGPVVNITTHIDARGATTDLVKALPEVLKRRDDALESKIVDGLRRGRYGV